MTNEEFKLLNDFIVQKCGIYYHEKQKYLFQQKILKRVEKNALKDFKEYYYLLKYNCTDEELQELYNVLTVNETYFMREKDQLLALRDIIIPEMLSLRPNRFIPILSAGCSTGEEPYSLSILLKEKINNPEKNISISGIDISQKAIDLAQNGNYRKISLTFRSIEKSYLNKYFDTTAESYNLKDEIKKSVKFRQANLFIPKTYYTGEKYEIIMCRNVMIYFSNSYKENLVRDFYNYLNPGGYLVLSNTENLNDINSDFSLIKKGNVFMYQKPM